MWILLSFFFKSTTRVFDLLPNSSLKIVLLVVSRIIDLSLQNHCNRNSTKTLMFNYFISTSVSEVSGFQPFWRATLKHNVFIKTQVAYLCCEHFNQKEDRRGKPFRNLTIEQREIRTINMHRIYARFLVSHMVSHL